MDKGKGTADDTSDVKGKSVAQTSNTNADSSEEAVNSVGANRPATKAARFFNIGSKINSDIQTVQENLRDNSLSKESRASHEAHLTFLMEHLQMVDSEHYKLLQNETRKEKLDSSSDQINSNVDKRSLEKSNENENVSKKSK